jgi:protein AroM
MDSLAMITVGQAPRDDLVPHMEAVFRRKVPIWQAGVLDGLSAEAVAMLAPDLGEVGIVARLLDGSHALLSHRKILPRVQALVDRAVERGPRLIVILCGSDWSALRSPVLIVNPGRIFPAVVSAVASGRRLGIIKPSAGSTQWSQPPRPMRANSACAMCARRQTRCETRASTWCG